MNATPTQLVAPYEEKLPFTPLARRQIWVYRWNGFAASAAETEPPLSVTSRNVPRRSSLGASYISPPSSEFPGFPGKLVRRCHPGGLSQVRSPQTTALFLPLAI